MTVIAWDGKTLAADKQCTSSGYATAVTKIFRVNDGLVGFAGSPTHGMALLDWIKAGRNLDTWPASRDPGSTADILFINNEGKIFEYSGTGGPYPEPCEESFIAMGSGRDYALAALYLGHGARRAVEVACALDVFCGKGIDTLEPK
jgi:ATP-dependent protease HslVU (ClpYQ) peptidase subunit